MRTRRLLLAASALSTLAWGCSTKSDPKPEQHTEPLPGNPKGSFYDAAMASPTDARASDALEPIAAPEPTYANTKGSYYDDAMLAGDPVAADAARARDAGVVRDAETPRDANAAPRDASPSDAGSRDAAAPARDAAVRRPPDARIVGNPKGSFYDKGGDSLE